MQDDHSITAMVQFMETDARQKAREYDDEAKQQYESDKTQFVKQETDKVLAQFEQKQKQLVVERRVAHATYAKTQRMRLLDLRNEQLQLVREAARAKLQAVVQQPAEYKSLMLQLLVQGAVAVQSDCVVRVRKVDEGLAKGLFSEAEATVKRQLGKAVRLSLDSTSSLDDTEAWGGAVLTGLDGRIICNNTIANRAGNAFQEQLPTIRHLLFHEMATLE